MKILIIGSKGFIGSNLVRSLSFAGHDIYEADVVVDYEYRCTYYLVDGINTDYNAIFEKQAFEVCINCSGAASVPLSLESPYKDFTLNTLNVFKILEAMRTYQPKCKFINLSSAAVYGNPEMLPIREEADLKPLSPYGIHKMQAEQICKEFNQFYEIPTCSLRIFSAYGNGLKKQLFWDLYQKFLKLDKVELFGTGNESRDFIHVTDIVNAIELVMIHADFKGEEINVANGEEYYIKDIAEIFNHYMKKHRHISFNNQVKKGDPINWRADISKLNALGYKQNMLINEGIKDYIKWINTLI